LPSGPTVNGEIAVTLEESGYSEIVPLGVIRAMATVLPEETAEELVRFENHSFPSGPVVNAEAPK
jgi:hypothetical protein